MVRLNKDGSLPRNEYNNFDLIDGEIPEGATYLPTNGLIYVCKKLKVEFVEVIIGKTHPLTSRFRAQEGQKRGRETGGPRAQRKRGQGDGGLPEEKGRAR